MVTKLKVVKEDLVDKKTIYARNTIIEPVILETAQAFIQKNHKQGKSTPKTTITSIGIFSKNLKQEKELLGIAQFCSPRTTAKKREYSTELLRLCFKQNYRIIGGASKLIKYYIKNYQPADIFTYQDTTGENSNVYEKCGFKLIRQEKKKKYFIAPGKTFNTADRTKNEILSFAYAVKLGPDNILKTNLGEIFDNKTGKRLTNEQIFVNKLNWTITETSGDKTYEWFNPNVSFYTYKITATDSKKYYYGVHKTNTPYNKTTIYDCLTDGYFGSGGTIFKNWFKKHKTNIRKEIIEIFEKQKEAYNNEKILIGELYKIDPLCLNNTTGGKYSGHENHKTVFENNLCKKHGLTIFQQKKCCKCVRDNAINNKVCDKHGLTKFQGNSCYKCQNEDTVKEKFCTKCNHLTKHQGKNCLNCKNSKQIIIKNCAIHGKTKHIGDKCYQCRENGITMKTCKKHGLTKFNNKNNCFKCIAGSRMIIKKCIKHGLTKHSGNDCCKCNAQKVFTIDSCEKHGEVKFRSGKCVKCKQEKRFSEKECYIHGLTKFSGDSCCKCQAEKTAHTRWHKNNKKNDCVYCLKL